MAQLQNGGLQGRHGGEDAIISGIDTIQTNSQTTHIHLTFREMFNTSGMLYREMGLKEKLASMPEDEMFALLATDGMLVKRPVLVSGNTVFFGFKENEWEGKLTR